MLLTADALPDRTGDPIAEESFSSSERARSCFMISAFSRFCAFFGLRAKVFANIRTPDRAIAAPMSMLVIQAVSLPCARLQIATLREWSVISRPFLPGEWRSLPSGDMRDRQ